MKLILIVNLILLCLHRFINYLPYKSDEMAHVAFPDEHYNKVIRMGKKEDLSDFERGMVVGARRAGLGISKIKIP